MSTFGERFAHARSLHPVYGPYRGMTALAEKIGVNVGTLSRYESEDRGTARPDYGIAKLIAAELGVLTDWLMDGTQPMRADGTLGPESPKQSLDDYLKGFPSDRWTPETVAAVRAAYARRGAPEGGWGPVLDGIAGVLSGKPKKRKK